MVIQYQVLASGSSGNASLLTVDGFGVLIDFGIGPRALAQRRAATGPFWDHVHAALLTHTHGDHWNENSLNQLARRRVPLHCHAEHAEVLKRQSPAFAALHEAGLVSCFDLDAPWTLGPGCRCDAFAVQHDGGVTCGFRFEGADSMFGGWALGFASDLGAWTPALAGRLADVDLLALEFNHDVALQYNSGRLPRLIRRVLGDHGHLSNVQAADLFAEVVRRSEPGRLRQLVQLHLSRHCNRPELARAAARQVIEPLGLDVMVCTAEQDQPGPCLSVGGGESVPRPRPPRGPRRRSVPCQTPSLFPDWE